MPLRRRPNIGQLSRCVRLKKLRLKKSIKEKLNDIEDTYFEGETNETSEFNQTEDSLAVVADESYSEYNEFSEGNERENEPQPKECKTDNVPESDIFAQNQSATSSAIEDVCTMNIVVPEFIKIVEGMRILWDRNCVSYKDREKREESWKEVCKIFNSKFDQLKESEQVKQVNRMSRKWYEIRERYFKYLKNGSSKRPYIHSELLTFLDSQYLKPVMPKWKQKKMKAMKNNDHGDSMKLSNKDSHNQEEEALEVDVDTTEVNKTSKNHTNSEDKLSAILEKMIESEQDNDWMFLSSVLTSVKSLSEESKLEFKISVLSLLKTLTEKDKESVENIKQEPILMFSNE